MSQGVGTDAADAESTATDISPRGVGWLLDHVSLPLYRNAYSLIMSSVLTSAIGFGFWFLAARLYSEESVGLNSVAISTIIFLAGLGQLNLVNGLNRFLPRAGVDTGRLMKTSYVIAAGLGGIIAVIFLLGVDTWSADLGFVASNPWIAAWFVMSVMGWCLFVLQDGVLAGLRQAQWVPVENVIYALAKLVLVVVMAVSIPRYGVFLAWTIPIPPLLLVVNVFVFRRLVPQHVANTRSQSEPVAFSLISRFVAGDYFASFFGMAAIWLLPVMILTKEGASATAHFYLSWVVAYALYLISRNMGMSLVAEAAHDPKNLPGLSYRAARQAMLLVAPAVLVVVVGAPLILRVFGDSYAVAATPLLRLLALSALPEVVLAIYASMLRSQRRVRALVILMAVQSASAVVLSWWLLDRMGIAGVGVALLVSATGVAAVVLFAELRPMWISQVDHRLIDWGARLHSTTIQRKAHRSIRPAASGALSHITTKNSIDTSSDPGQWEILHIFTTNSDVSTVSVGAAGGPAEAVLKISNSDRGRDALEQHTAVMRDIEQDYRLSDWAGNVPDILAVDELDGRLIVLDRAIDGKPLTRLLQTTSNEESALTSPIALISDFHHRTSSERPADDELLRELIRRPFESVRESILDRPGWADKLDETEKRLTSSLTGKSLIVSRTHGDFAPGNILLNSDEVSVAGVIDWDQAKPIGLPDLDIVFLMLAARMVSRREELGSVVVALTETSTLTKSEQSLLDRYGLNSARGLDVETLVLLAWIHHAASNVTKAAGYRTHQIWLERNIGHVLNTR